MGDFCHETERLILRDWRDEDWEPFFCHTNTPAVMEHLGGVMDADKEQWARDRIETYHREDGFTFWVVERKADGGHLSGEIIGFCGLKRCNQEGGPIGDYEAGWRLREEAWGHGYAKEAAEATLRIGFDHFAAPHIIALTVIGNRPSWGLMRKLGMERRADLDFPDTLFTAENGEPETMIVYKITKEQWDRLQ